MLRLIDQNLDLQVSCPLDIKDLKETITYPESIWTLLLLMGIYDGGPVW